MRWGGRALAWGQDAWPLRRALELSPGWLLRATLDTSLLSLGLSSRLGKVGMIITAPLTSQAGAEDLRDDGSGSAL